MQNIWNEITGKLRNFFHSRGFTKAVIGGSGGIDSSVVICLAVEALGAKNVLVAMMPAPHSSEGSVTDTLKLCSNWGVTPVTLPIERLMGEFNTSLANISNIVTPPLGNFPKVDGAFTYENIQARIRMVLLMALSNEYGCLVLNTCNKSEDYTGYCTLYGDSCGAIAPIGDLYKGEVYELAEWITYNPVLPNIPFAILHKAPTAELREGQLDSDEIPPYEELDPILTHLLDEGLTVDSVVTLGHDANTVAKVQHLMNGSGYKRDQSAPVLKLERKG